MSLATLVLCAELPELDESTQPLSWAELEAWAVAMREELPVAAVVAALERLWQDLLERVCGPKWLPVRDLPAPFGCPLREAMSDFVQRMADPPSAAGYLRRDGPDPAGPRRLPFVRAGLRAPAVDAGPVRSAADGPSDA